ncbi:MAG: hypothetical protein HUK26_04905 [Duodenibacillus sp.]|nr:hypothetical protein [Duodenibacillus sp.]
MQITSAEQLLTSLDASRHFKLEDGVLKTENAFFHALRNLLSSSSAIAERNRQLRGAMAGMLARQGLHSVSEAIAAKGGEAPGHLLGADARRSICRDLSERLLARAIAGEAAALPADRRACAVRVANLVIHSKGLAGDRQAAAALARQIMAKLAADQDWQTMLGCDFGLSHAEMADFYAAVAQGMKETYVAQRATHIKDGLHDAFPPDAERRSVRTINHAPCSGGAEGAAAAYEQLKALIPDPRMRGFVTMMASQAGPSGDIMMQAMNPVPGKQLSYGEVLAKGLIMRSSDSACDITVQDGKCHMHFEVDIEHELADWEGDSQTRPQDSYPPAIGGGRYYMDMEIDLAQDWPEGEAPAFTVSGCRRPMPMPDSDPVLPAALQGEEARACVAALGDKLGLVLAQAAATARACPPALLSMACGPLDGASGANQLMKLARGFKAAMEPLLAGAPQGVREAAFEAGFTALLAYLPGVAEAAALNREAVAEAMLQIEGFPLREIEAMQTALERV